MKTWVFLRGARRDGGLKVKGSTERTGPPPSSNLEKNGDMWTHYFLVWLKKLG